MLDDFELSCMLFDLDGTLLDTAPDLIASLNKALRAEDLPAVDFNSVRPYISFGAAVMIEQSLHGTEDSRTHDRVLEQMLHHYQQNIADHTRFFEGMAEMLDTLESNNIKWGVITNKRTRFTEPLMRELNLAHRAACIISGDSTDNSKPHPEPMHAACKQAEVEPENCIYIGDSAHDIEAGNRAGMKTLAATYGYIKPGDRPENWGAAALIDKPTDLKHWLMLTH
jgi:phosphoglycolate phosphatase